MKQEVTLSDPSLDNLARRGIGAKCSDEESGLSSPPRDCQYASLLGLS
jgi:hypothetical protein